MRAVAPALALGNAVVLKPSIDTPISGGLLLAKIFDQTSLPKGLFTVVPGSGGEIGDQVATNPINRVVAFTGIAEVGREVASKAAHNLARPAMDLGGNNVHIVLERIWIEQLMLVYLVRSFTKGKSVCEIIDTWSIDHGMRVILTNLHNAQQRSRWVIPLTLPPILDLSLTKNRNLKSWP